MFVKNFEKRFILNIEYCLYCSSQVHTDFSIYTNGIIKRITIKPKSLFTNNAEVSDRHSKDEEINVRR